MTLVAHAVRRGLEYYSTRSTSLVKRDSQQDEIARKFMSLGGFAIFATIIVFFIGIFMIDYTVSYVIATLAMIETPTSSITVTPASDNIALKGGDEAKAGLLETGPSIELVAQKPITAKIRATVRHLRANAGKFAPWRGLSLHWLYHMSFVFVANFLEQLLPKVPGMLIVITALTGALLAQLHVSWTHKVVAMPTTAPFWKRFVSVSEWKALALPAALQASATYISIYIVQGLVFLMGLDRIDQKETATTGQQVCVALQALSIIAIAFACGLFLCLPATVTLVRIESSILPEDQETIVPFDRTFGGKVEPRIHGGTGRVGFVDAWKSFNWEARRRLIKLYFKNMAIGAALGFIFAHVILLELWAFMGAAVLKQIADQQAQRNGAF